ncbi:fibronectin type III domain-containing protein [Paenibacillus sp. sptzw28]|uniref:rhamnogalacturonan lyase family protein n=1 Tax=Paenibacillus sp. sptzw28 TaxID=715179 RepID=UPI0028690DE6|nr:fibronectin type III domain-containing protein [Paenibacillus sp. sptzw28]
MYSVIVRKWVAALLIFAMMFISIPPVGAMDVAIAPETGEPVIKQFDFGTPASPVSEGFNQVHDQLLYSQTLGYGLDRTIASRDRGDAATSEDDMEADFVLGMGFTFMADIPNGEYDVTVYSGDRLVGTSTTKTTISLEGREAGTISARQATASATYRTVVQDGQLTVYVTGAGVGGYLNGLIVREAVPTPPAAPATLSVLSASREGVVLQWSSVTDAVYYNLYRSIGETGTYFKLAQTPDVNYTDTAVLAGSSYTYYVTALNAGGMESAPSPSATATVTLVAIPPKAPTNLEVTSVTSRSVELRWTASEDADGYAVFRSASLDGPFAEIGAAQATSYSDQTDTSSVWYYQVKSTNEAGYSEGSNIAQSAVYKPPTPLPDAMPVRMDFGPGALQDGYIRVSSDTEYGPDWKYGFVDPSKVGSVDRGTDDALRSDFVTPGGTSLLIDLPAGDYSVTVIAGDALEATDVGIVAESIQKVQTTAVPAGQYIERSFDIALVDGQLNLSFTGAAPKLNALVIAKLPARTTGVKPTAYIAGDSTVQTYDPYWRPQAGWGQMIQRFFTTDVMFDNRAIGGRSSKSFIFEGRLDNILRVIRPGDYFLIQFGHNDATISIPERYASPADYKEYLRTYVNGTRQRGATPILVTPVGRRSYNSETGKFNVSFPEYVAKMKELAAELDVALVDLSSLSVAYYDSIGPEGTLSVFMHVPAGMYQAFPNGAADNTHFQEYGAIQLARLLSGGIRQLDLPLAAYVTDIEPPAEVPAKPTGLIASNVSNAGATLTWDETAGADIYKIYRKLATDNDYAIVATSTVPFANIGGMEEGRTYLARVVAVNGRGESEPSDAVTIGTKRALYKYDIGPAGSPVAAGYTEVNLSTVYTPQKGYGIADSTNMIGRDRGTGNDLIRDWLGYFNARWEFKVDLPNGLYASKVYVGDMIGSARTDVAVEGKSYGTVTSPSKSYTERVISPISVKDGQMNFVFSGSTGIVNGLEITPIMLAPSELKIDRLELDSISPSVAISWKAVDDAVLYNVYRQEEGKSGDQMIGSVNTNAYTDTTVDVGIRYTFTVTAVDKTGTETVPSMPLDVSMIDPNVPVPPVPTQLTLGAVNKNDITFSWNASEGAGSYNVYRTKKENGVYEWIGRTRQTSFTDTGVLTTIPYYYRVAAVSAGGVSGQSETMVTPAVTVLKRQMENIDRALVAVKTDERIYISWRMLGTDPDDISFNLYRDGVKINGTPIVGSTNYVDAEGAIGSHYEVRPVIDGVEQPRGERASVWNNAYLDVPLQKPEGGVTPIGDPYTYSANDASTADLDGDGKYELIVKWDPSNSHDNSHSGYTGNVYLDAYKLDGTHLWRIDMGRNIRAGAHYTQFMAYDLDGDGKAEIAAKTADGTVDGAGQVIGDANADFRYSNGYILAGPEYLTIFNGESGKALVTTDYDPPRGNVADWGDGYGNRADRFLAGVAYLDGERPSLIMARGYYTRTVVVAYNYRDSKLSKLWRFDTNDDGYEQFVGEGNHQLSVADVDFDGKDEIIYGAMTIDDDGKPLYKTGLGHGDALHVSDFAPNRPGLEVFDVHEHYPSPAGIEFRDAETGEKLWGIPTNYDVGRGMAADIDPRYPGAEMWAVGSSNWDATTGGVYSVDGTKISDNIPSVNFGIWWDGDLLRELLDHSFNQSAGVGVGKIDKWDYENSKLVRMMTATGTFSNNYTKGTPNLQADLFGDWREEVVWRTEDSSALRIYTTTDVTGYRFRTLMHDPQYRLAVAWQNVGYNQPPHPSFYLGDGMKTQPKPNIYLVPASQMEISAEADVKPDTLKLSASSNENAVTAYIELPGNGQLVDVATVQLHLNGKSISAQSEPSTLGDYDADGIPDTMVKFEGQKVRKALAGQSGNVTMTVTGLTKDGRFFSARDTVAVTP